MSLNQLYTLVCFILTGVSIGVLFDIFRIFRRSFKTSDIITYIHDFLFWILTGVILLFSIFTFNNGELRRYIFIGIIFGIILYILIFSKYFIKFFVTIISFIKKIIGYPIKILFSFINKHIFSPIYNIFCKFKRNFKFKLPKINFKIRKNDKLSNKIQQ